MNFQITHNPLRKHSSKSITNALANTDSDLNVQIKKSKNMVHKSSPVYHSIKLNGKGVRKTVVLVDDDVTMLEVYSGNITLSNLTIILGNHSQVIMTPNSYNGWVQLSHVQIYHLPTVVPSKNYPSLEIVSEKTATNLQIDLFDCQIDDVSLKSNELSISHCQIGNLWSKTSMIGANKGEILNTILANICIQSLGYSGIFKLNHNTSQGLVSLSGHISIKNITFQAPNAPTGWIARHRLHQVNHVYKLPQAVSFLISTNENHFDADKDLSTYIIWSGQSVDTKSFQIWNKDSHLALRPRWASFHHSSIKILNMHVPHTDLLNLAYHCTLTEYHTVDSSDYWDYQDTNSLTLHDFKLQQRNMNKIKQPLLKPVTKIEEMSGMSKVSQQLNKWVAHVNLPICLAFMGTKGSGKHTVAKIISTYLKQQSLLDNGTYHEIDAKTIKSEDHLGTIIKSSLNGVLVIDNFESMLNKSNMLALLFAALNSFENKFAAILIGGRNMRQLASNKLSKQQQNLISEWVTFPIINKTNAITVLVSQMKINHLEADNDTTAQMLANGLNKIVSFHKVNGNLISNYVYWCIYHIYQRLRDDSAAEFEKYKGMLTVSDVNYATRKMQ